MVLVVVALVVPILLLAHKIGKRSGEDQRLRSSSRCDNTAALKELHTTIDHAEVIVAGPGARTQQAGRMR